MKYPFEVPFREVEAAPEVFVSAIFSSLASEFLVLPKGDGFIDYPTFEAGYEALKKATGGFSSLSPREVMRTIEQHPIAWVVLRAMLGFTPPEWAFVAAQQLGPGLTQGFARTFDRKVRISPLSPLRLIPESRKRVEAMVSIACELLERGCPEVRGDQLHRL